LREPLHFLGCMDHFQQCHAVNQLDGLASRKCLRVTCECAHADDFDPIGTVMGQKPCHFPYNTHTYLSTPPLLALHQNALASFAEHKVDSPICTAHARFLDNVTLTPECLTHQLLELAPTGSSHARQRGTCVQEDSATPGAKEGEEGGHPAHRQQQPGQGRQRVPEAAGDTVSQPAVLPREPPRDGVANATEEKDANQDANRPRHSDQGIHSA